RPENAALGRKSTKPLPIGPRSLRRPQDVVAKREAKLRPAVSEVNTENADRRPDTAPPPLPCGWTGKRARTIPQRSRIQDGDGVHASFGVGAAHLRRRDQTPHFPCSANCPTRLPCAPPRPFSPLSLPPP